MFKLNSNLDMMKAVTNIAPEGHMYTVIPGIYAETRPSVLWTGKTKCGLVFICLDGFNFFF